MFRDADLLDKLARYLAGNIGSLVSSKSIADYLKSSGRSVSTETIDNYLRALEEAYLFYRARRNDLRGKGLMKTHNKFYLVDTGLRLMLQGSDHAREGKVLENIVYFELLRRGYQVSVGKHYAQEIDFVADAPGTRHYYQVTQSMLDDEVKKRELKPLQALKDNHPKTILSTDPLLQEEWIEGIHHQNVIDFLLADWD